MKTIVITGAGSGLGRALARSFAADGDRVILLGRTAAKLRALAAELGRSAHPIACDISIPDQVRAAFAEINAMVDGIDVLINNAAMIDYARLSDASDRHILETVGTNLVGTLLCSRSAISMMERGGHIINISSGAVTGNDPHLVVYQATKGGVECLSRHLQDELVSSGIRVTVVRAGPMYDEDYTLRASSEAIGAFNKACAERGVDYSRTGVTHFRSLPRLFRELVDLPADMHVGTVHFTSRKP